MPPKKAKEKPLDFDQRLVLNQWLVSLFEAGDFETVTEPLRNADLEGIDEDGVSRFHRQLILRLQRNVLPDDLLLAYDQNIVRHWRRITERRGDGRVLHMKYFQYLALLFTEIYLDRYFSDQETLLEALNNHVAQFNEGKPPGYRVPEFEPGQLNKLAFWMATGSGKTLLMHCNIEQFRDYLARKGDARSLNRVILLTPNEGLSRQHLDEFELSGMQAELFQKEGRGLFAGHAVEIIDIHKLKEDQGLKTVAIDAFEGNNLVLVDEGHRGAGGTEWMATRNRICEKGFSFEYSATFGQAMKAAKKKDLTDEYARNILFDYSYRYFYRDGYGKDYRILNLAQDTDQDVRRKYLTACLLTFYQQVRVFSDQKQALVRFLLESPLFVFVGAKVNAVRTENANKVSDVVDILLFLDGFVHERERSVGYIDQLLKANAGLLDSRNRDLFATSFGYLVQTADSAEAIFDDILRRVFNASTGAALHVDDLKGADGEIELRLGDFDPFGVINVGDTSTLLKLCEDKGLNTGAKEFSRSLFRDIDKPDSTVRILIGSKKFTEGWSSWRVSTMGLMHVGKSEGSEIIQLFGRGVRLKGYEFCLKRSGHVAGIDRPSNIQLLETLNVLGVRADYMQQFRQYLEDEGLPGDQDIEEFTLPTITMPGIPAKKLRTIHLQDGIDFKRDGPKPTLEIIDEIKLHPVVVDWYPRIQAMAAAGVPMIADVTTKHEAKLESRHLAFMDFDAIWFDLQRFKNEKTWHNFNLPRSAPRELLESPDWYRLYIPAEQLEFREFARVRVWREIAVALLTKYCDRLYKEKKKEFEAGHLEYRELTPEDANFVPEYQVLVEQSQTAVIEALKQLKTDIEGGALKDIGPIGGGSFQAFKFDRHLYNPLIHVKSSLIEVKPVALNKGESDFVVGLRKYCENNAAFFEKRELYLLRNRSRSGIGFFEAGNFYPDFIVWLIDGGRQYITFVDPKGIRNLDGPEDRKIRFHKTIKETEAKLGDPAVILNSFILSVTPYGQGGWWTGTLSEEEMGKRNVLFLEDGPESVVDRMLKTILTVIA